MTERTPCKNPECSNTILPTTAERTGGLCGPCVSAAEDAALRDEDVACEKCGRRIGKWRKRRPSRFCKECLEGIHAQEARQFLQEMPSVRSRMTCLATALWLPVNVLLLPISLLVYHFFWKRTTIPEETVPDGEDWMSFSFSSDMLTYIHLYWERRGTKAVEMSSLLACLLWGIDILLRNGHICRSLSDEDGLESWDRYEQSIYLLKQDRKRVLFCYQRHHTHSHAA